VRLIVAVCMVCWKGKGYRKYLKEKEKKRIFERGLVFMT